MKNVNVIFRLPKKPKTLNTVAERASTEEASHLTIAYKDFGMSLQRKGKSISSLSYPMKRRF